MKIFNNKLYATKTIFNDNNLLQLIYSVSQAITVCLYTGYIDTSLIGELSSGYGTGGGNRKVLPACVVTAIRRTFPPENYTGFQESHLTLSGKPGAACGDELVFVDCSVG